MRQTINISLLALSMCLSVVAQTKPQGNGRIEQALMQLEHDWSAAYLKHDVATVDRLLAEEYVGIDGRGIITNKAQEIEEAKPPRPETPKPAFTVLDETVTEMKIRLYGKVAVVTGRTTERIEFKGKESNIQYRRTTVWVKREGRWQCVSFHGSRIIEPPKQ